MNRTKLGLAVAGIVATIGLTTSAASAATLPTPTPVIVKHAPAGYFYQVDWVWANNRIGDADGPFTYNTQAKADAIGGKPYHPGMIARIVLATLSD
jgi:hypothetical protein